MARVPEFTYEKMKKSRRATQTAPVTLTALILALSPVTQAPARYGGAVYTFRRDGSTCSYRYDRVLRTLRSSK